jgi:hypothetical protein
VNIFDTIKAQSNLKKAESIRAGSGVSLRDQCAKASKEKMEGFGDKQIDAFVDVLLTKAAGYSLAECVELVPELGQKDKQGEAARTAVIEAAVMSGQYFKATMRNALKGIIEQLHVRVADTVSVIATEATISTLQEPKQLEGGKINA